MANSLLERTTGNVLVRTFAVAIVVLGLFAVGSGALPVRCWIGKVCDTTAPVTAATATKTVPSVEQAAVSPAPTVQQPAAPSSTEPAPGTVPQIPNVKIVPVVAKPAPSLTQNDVLAATFAQLRVELQAPGKPSTSPVQVAAALPPVSTPGAAQTVTDPDTGLNKRIVKAVSIRPDGTPDLTGTEAVGYTESPPTADDASSYPAVDAATRIGAGQPPSAEPAPAPRVAEVHPPAKASAPADKTGSSGGNIYVVLGSGVNVHSNYGKGNKILFAIAGGEKVTVLDTQHGWMKIRDDQGRTGWVWNDGLKKG